jgi:hypothetical protein
MTLMAVSSTVETRITGLLPLLATGRKEKDIALVSMSLLPRAYLNDRLRAPTRLEAVANDSEALLFGRLWKAI